MLNLDTLLDRFKKSLGKDVLAKEAVVSVVEGTIGIRLQPQEITLKDFMLEINTSPIKKNEIRLNEAEILAGIRARTGQNITKIFYK
jgi:hypothetical protein